MPSCGRSTRGAFLAAVQAGISAAYLQTAIRGTRRACCRRSEPLRPLADLTNSALPCLRSDALADMTPDAVRCPASCRRARMSARASKCGTGHLPCNRRGGRHLNWVAGEPVSTQVCCQAPSAVDTQADSGRRGPEYIHTGIAGDLTRTSAGTTPGTNTLRLEAPRGAGDPLGRSLSCPRAALKHPPPWPGCRGRQTWRRLPDR
jgi:hypothetical protein